MWSGAPRFHTGGIVGGLKSRERAIIAEDNEAVFPTVRMGNGDFGIRATGFNGGGGGGNSDTVSFGDINIQTSGSSGDSQKDAEHSKMMAREMKESLCALVREELRNNTRSGGMYTMGINR